MNIWDRQIKVGLFCLVIVLVSLKVTASFAGEVKQLSLNESIKLAITQNNSIAAAKENVSAAEARVREAILNWLPRFNFAVDVNFYKKEPYQGSGASTNEVEIIPGVKIPASFLSSQGNEYYDSNFTLSATQLLWDSGKVASQISAAYANLELAKLQLIKKKNEISNQITGNFFKYFDLNKEKTLLIEKEALAQKLLDEARENFAEGRTGELEIIDKRIDLFNIKQDIVSLQDDASQIKDQILQLVNLPIDEEVELLFEKENYVDSGIGDKDRILKETEKNNYDVRAARLTAKIKECEILRSKSETNPAVNFYGNRKYFKTGDTLRKSFSDYDRSWNVGISVNWPFFDSWRTWNKVAASVDDFQKEEKNLEEIKAGTLVKVRGLCDKLAAAREKIDLCREKRDITKDRLDISEKFVEKGKLSDNDLEARKVDFMEAEIESEKAMTAYCELKRKLNEMMGRGEYEN